MDINSPNNRQVADPTSTRIVDEVIPKISLSYAALSASRLIGHIANKLFSKKTDEPMPAGKTIIATASALNTALEKTSQKLSPVTTVVDTALTQVAIVARQTQAFVTSEKTQAFFTKGIAGQALVKLAADSISEIGAALIAGQLVSDGFAVANGSKDLSSMYANALPFTAILLLILSNLYGKHKVFEIYKTIMSFAIVTTAASQIIKLDNPSTMQNVGQYAASFMASIIAGYQVSHAESGLSFGEYFNRNIRQALATGYINLNYSSAPALVRQPFNMIAGSLAYSSKPIYELITKMTSMKDAGKRKDLALKAKEFLEGRNCKALEEATQARALALTNNEDVTPHDTKIAELQKQSTTMKTLMDNLDQFLRIGFKSFNEYQKILREVPKIAEKQSDFVDIYRKAAKFEETLKKTGIESTEDYKEAQRTNPRSLQNLDQFIENRRRDYQRQKEEAKTSLSAVLWQAISKTHTLTQSVINMVIPSGYRSLEEQLLGSLPQIQETESALIGFPITDSTNEEITKELTKIHLLGFFSLAGPSVFQSFLSAMMPGALRPASEAAPLEKDDDVNLAEGLLNLVMSHYSRVNADSRIAHIVQATFQRTFPLLRSSLNEGITATFVPSLAEFNDLRETDDEIAAARQAEAQAADDSWVMTEIPVRAPSPTPSQSSEDDFELVEADTIPKTEQVAMAQLSLPKTTSTQETQTDDLLVNNLEEQVAHLKDENTQLRTDLTQKQETLIATSRKTNALKDAEIEELKQTIDSQNQAAKTQTREIKHLQATLASQSKDLSDQIKLNETHLETIGSLDTTLKETLRVKDRNQKAFLEQEQKLQELAAAVANFYKDIEKLNADGLLADLAGHESFRPLAEHTQTLAILGKRYSEARLSAEEEG